MKHKRVWSDEQKAAAKARMEARWSQKRTAQAAVEGQQIREASIKSAGFIDRTPTTVTRDPEVQAVLDTMTPERKAKLEMIQAKNLAMLAQTKEGREALERMEARHEPEPITGDFEIGDKRVVMTPDHTVIFEQKPIETQLPPTPAPRMELPMKVPFRLTGSVSGLMVSELGNCVCGEVKLKWHPVCLKVKA